MKMQYLRITIFPKFNAILSKVTATFWGTVPPSCFECTVCWVSLGRRQGPASLFGSGRRARISSCSVEASAWVWNPCSDIKSSFPGSESEWTGQWCRGRSRDFSLLQSPRWHLIRLSWHGSLVYCAAARPPFVLPIFWVDFPSLLPESSCEL